MDLFDERLYDPATCAVFCKSADPLGSLQNMTGKMPLTYRGRVYQSSEGAYQAQKFPGQHDVQEAIANSPSGFSAKLIAKKYQITDPDWDNRRVWVMWDVLQTKWQHHEARIRGDIRPFVGLPLVELSRRDGFWGARPQPDGTLKGANVLGKLWEAVIWPLSWPHRIQEIISRRDGLF